MPEIQEKPSDIEADHQKQQLEELEKEESEATTTSSDKSDKLEAMPISTSHGKLKDDSSRTTSEFKNLTRPKVLFLAFLFAASQLIQELVSEAIFTQYETDRLTYETAMLYSCFQQLGTVVVALIIMAYSAMQPIGSGGKNGQLNGGGSVIPSWWMMGLLAVLVFASTALPNWAVEFVYFPAKVVAKSTKLVPTMVVSVLMGNSKKFTFVDYCSAILLCSGAAGFALHSGRVEVDDDGVETVKENLWIGLVLLTIASFADALVPNLQQVVMRAGSSAEQVALRVNIMGASWVGIFLFFSGALKEWFFIIFLKQPQLFLLMLTGSATLGVAVLAYTMLIREAGSVVAVAVATARKVLTLTLSYIVFPGDGKTFGMSHAVSAFAVALGMALGPLYERWKSYRSSSGSETQYSRV